ncbi:MAG: hypothetical protein DSY80_10950 [Desulfocapsa sp.]|nr:MAG: hypothetical protein DSY80_10950 [Desulfocapsa sp.]
MEKVLVSLPDDLARRMRVVIPPRQRSKVVAALLQKEVEQREQALYRCACKVEADEDLNREMAEWEPTISDGLTNETW